MFVYIYIYIYYIYIYIKGNFLPIYRPWCMYIMYQPTSDTCINICPQSASYILVSSSSFPSPFATNVSYPFLISLNPPLATQFSRHILSNVFDHSVHIAAVFHNCQFCVLSVVSHMNYLYVYRITNIKTTAILKRSHICHVKCQHAMCTYKPQSTVGQK